MRNVEQTPLWLDIKDIIESKDKPIRKEYRGMFHTTNTDTNVIKIRSIDIVRDYVENIGDHINIEFIIGLGDYIYKLYPYRNNLEFTIKTIFLKESSDKIPTNTIITNRYKAIFLPNENQVHNTGNLAMHDAESLNKSDIVTVKLQLLDIAIEAIRIKTTQGIFKNVTMKQLLSSILLSESNKIIIDGKPSIPNIDLVEPDNTEIKKHIIIPSGTLISSVPGYLQNDAGGVYNTNIGVYIQNYNNINTWFVYPLLNIDRFEKDVEKLAIYAIPLDRYSGLTKTYKKVGKVLSILAVSKYNYKDSADTDFMNNGSGYRFTDARAFMKKPIEISENGPIGKRANLNSEVSIADRDDGLNFAPVSSNISVNQYKARSLVNFRNIARIDFMWENCDTDLLYPGMPCEFNFLSHDKVVKLKGLVVAVHNFTSQSGTTINDHVYSSKASVTIFVNKYDLKLETDNLSPGVF